MTYTFAFIVENVLVLDPIPRQYDFLFQSSPAYAYVVSNDEYVTGYGRGRLVGTHKHGLSFYLRTWVLLVILFVWLVVPLGIGYLRFRDAEVA